MDSKRMEPPFPVFFVFLFLIACGCSQARRPEFFTAAVFEHARQGDDFKDDAAAVVKANLEYYEKATELARKQGADLILFPEYGLFFSEHNRSGLKPYLESIPDPSEERVASCDENRGQILKSLSCMARRNSIVVAANMGGIEKCAGDIDCPEDGDLHLNANVVFDKNGTLIARYYKEHLFFEPEMDVPRKPQVPVFDTEFGRFATFICFDIIFEKMARVARRRDVDAILFTTMWDNSSPFFVSTQWWQAFALGNRATILASNIQQPGWLAAGSGIFLGSGKSSAAYALNFDKMSKLIVSRVPRRDSGKNIPSASITAISKNSVFPDWKTEGRDMPEVCSYLLSPAKGTFKEYRCRNENVQNYTLAKLVKAQDQLEVCHNGMCCRLDYAANGMNESYYLGVYNGTHNDFNTYFWEEENCFLARCDDANGTQCRIFPTVSHDTLFHRIFLKANFSTKYTYPSLLGNKQQVIPAENWNFRNKAGWSSISLKSSMGIPLTAATIKGRVYNKDPPYVR